MEEFEIPKPPRANYLNAEHGVKSWLLTKDHKRIALLYLGAISFFFFIGSLYAIAIRLELLTPQADLVQSSTYNKMFTQHGIIMVFFFLIPSIPATLGNFLIPLMIGAKDLAFPRINLLSWYLYILGSLITLHALINGGVGDLRQRLLLDPHRAQLHRDHPQDAGPRPHLVPPPPLRVGPLRHLGH